MRRLVLCLMITWLVGCQTALRRPASHSVEIESEAKNAYAIQNAINQLEDQKQILKSRIDNRGPRSGPGRYSQKTRLAIEKVKKRIKKEKASLENSLRTLQNQSKSFNTPVVSKLEFIEPWRFQTETFELTNLSAYSYEGDQPLRVFAMAAHDTRKYELTLKQSTSAKKSSLESELACNRTYEFLKSKKSLEKSPGEIVQFKWKHKSSDQKIRIRISDPQTECVLKFKDQTQLQTWSGVRLIPESTQYPDLIRLSREFQACSLPHAEHFSGPEKFFLTPHYTSLTCPETSQLKILGNPIEGLTERIKTLTGLKLPKSVIEARNPYIELDFSRAPKLDIIVISSLVFRSDFYGQLLARALVWHAQRGTVVRIINSKVLELSKDRKMFNEMIAASDNIKVQSYSFKAQKKSLRPLINQLHRVSHTKIFATYSREQPEASVAILGGRNVHEGYILPVAMERLGLPDLIDYARGEDPFLFYRDVEAVAQSREAASSVISHFLTLWQRQPDAYIRSMSLNLQTPAETDHKYFANAHRQPLVRHVLSMPYKDDRELMDVYADLIESAEREIKITTPYFLPTKKVGKALERAVQRGVDVTVITKTDLQGDNPDFDFLTMTANKMSINRYWDKFKIYDYQVEKSLLHSKLVLIDGRLSVIGSINLNRRSFYHDVENALIVYSSTFNQQLTDLFKEFESLSTKVEGKMKTDFLHRLLVKIINREL